MATKRISIIRNNTKTLPITFTDSASNPYCLKNWVIFFTMKKSYDLPDSEASVQKVYTTFSDSTSGTSGSANIAIEPSDTGNLDIGEYDFDISVTTADQETYTVLKGKVDLEYNVTKSVGTAGTSI